MIKQRLMTIGRARSWKVLLPTAIVLVGVTGIGVAAIPGRAA